MITPIIVTFIVFVKMSKKVHPRESLDQPGGAITNPTQDAAEPGLSNIIAAPKAALAVPALGMVPWTLDFYKNTMIEQAIVNWKTTDLTGTILYSTPVTPRLLNDSVALLATMNTAYAGTMDFQVRVIGTGFTGGVLAMMWTPPAVGNLSSIPADATIYPTELLDARAPDFVSIQCVDSNPKLYHPLHTNDISEEITGYFYVYVFAPLIVTGDATSVNVKIMSHLGADFTFLGPRPMSTPVIKDKGPDIHFHHLETGAMTGFVVNSLNVSMSHKGDVFSPRFIMKLDGNFLQAREFVGEEPKRFAGARTVIYPVGGERPKTDNTGVPYGHSPHQTHQCDARFAVKYSMPATEGGEYTVALPPEIPIFQDDSAVCKFPRQVPLWYEVQPSTVANPSGGLVATAIHGEPSDRSWYYPAVIPAESRYTDPFFSFQPTDEQFPNNVITPIETTNGEVLIFFGTKNDADACGEYQTLSLWTMIKNKSFEATHTKDFLYELRDENDQSVMYVRVRQDGFMTARLPPTVLNFELKKIWLKFAQTIGRTEQIPANPPHMTSTYTLKVQQKNYETLLDTQRLLVQVLEDDRVTDLEKKFVRLQKKLGMKEKRRAPQPPNDPPPRPVVRLESEDEFDIPSN